MALAATLNQGEMNWFTLGPTELTEEKPSVRITTTTIRARSDSDTPRVSVREYSGTNIKPNVS